MQGPNQPYTDFLARLRVPVKRAIEREKISEILLQTLAFKNANTECKHILGPLKGQGASIADYIRACLGVRRTEHQANVFATALDKAMKPQKRGNYFHCGKPGHMRRECQKLKADQGAIPKDRSLAGRTKTPPGPCRRCRKGLLWTNEGKSKTEKNGQPNTGKLSCGPKSLGPRNNTGDFSSLSSCHPA